MLKIWAAKYSNPGPLTHPQPVMALSSHPARLVVHPELTDECMRRCLRAFLLLSLIPLSAVALAWWWHVPDGPWLIHSKPLARQRICVIGDGGWGNNASRAIGQALVSLQCDQVRYLGDLVYPSGIQSVDDPLLKSRFLDPLTPALDAGIPVYLVLGNHDWKGNASAWLSLARQNPLIHFPNYYYFEEWPDACAFSLGFAHHPLVSSGSHPTATPGRTFN